MKTKAMLALVVFTGAVFSTEALSLPQNRTALNLTVYNGNRALVQENRKISLAKGISTIRFEGVPATIIPQSLIVVSKDGLNVLEQNYEFDLISREKLLEKYVGKEVTLIDEDKILSDKKNVSAKIVANNFLPVFEVNGKILLGFDGKILLPQIPENLYAKPTMNWIVQAQKTGDFNVDVSYLTNEISWNADYVLLLADNDKSASITSWITLTNQSGASFENAKLSLVAGDVNMVRESGGFLAASADAVMYNGAGMQKMREAPRVEEKSVDEYHMYSVNSPVSINDRQKKQIEMFSAQNINVKKRYRIQSGSYGAMRGILEKGNPLNVQTEIVFETGKKNNLDMPFPKGVVRMYKKDGANNVFLGEDNINHTPINEEITLKSGNAFDISCFEKKISDRKLSEQKTEFVKEITFSNHKKESVTLIFDERNLYGKWSIKSDDKYKKIDANTARFELNIPSGQDVVLKYTATIEM
ncbi:MAG: hypothetical protein LBH98_04785 [Chitinispirillales bacterium]|jgi:hypothetical protein|nr:hypothetical protein [Chitinispirillales bacterium]